MNEALNEVAVREDDGVHHELKARLIAKAWHSGFDRRLIVSCAVNLCGFRKEYLPRKEQ